MHYLFLLLVASLGNGFLLADDSLPLRTAAYQNVSHYLHRPFRSSRKVEWEAAVAHAPFCEEQETGELLNLLKKKEQDFRSEYVTGQKQILGVSDFAVKASLVGIGISVGSALAGVEKVAQVSAVGSLLSGVTGIAMSGGGCIFAWKHATQMKRLEHLENLLEERQAFLFGSQQKDAFIEAPSRGYEEIQNFLSASSSEKFRLMSSRLSDSCASCTPAELHSLLNEVAMQSLLHEEEYVTKQLFNRALAGGCIVTCFSSAVIGVILGGASRGTSSLVTPLFCLSGISLAGAGVFGIALPWYEKSRYNAVQQKFNLLMRECGADAEMTFQSSVSFAPSLSHQVPLMSW